MSDSGLSCQSQQNNIKTSQLCEGWEDEGRRMKRREKNRVAAQKSRKRQTQRADVLHEVCEPFCLFMHERVSLQVDSLSEEQHLLTEALRAHEPFCPIMHCSFVLGSNPSFVEFMSKR
uniref:Basic leucine zipper transcription factor, ATF-like 3 n=1 Tax=Amphilophus citrinellus TaxID=61819 RepID=A0A3Q0S8D7_AMPCI